MFYYCRAFVLKAPDDIISTDEDTGLRIESFAIIRKIRGISTKYNLYCYESKYSRFHGSWVFVNINNL